MPRRWPVVAAIAVVVALIVAGGAWAATRSGSSPADDVSDGGERVVIPSMTLGQGDLPNGGKWTLDVRREGGVCITIGVSTAPPIPERCLRTASYRPVGNLSTRILRGPSGVTNVTVGQISERVERVRVAPDGSPFFDTPVLGAGTGLGVRFFVAVTTGTVPVSFTVYGADGTQLGRADRRPAGTP